MHQRPRCYCGDGTLYAYTTAYTYYPNGKLQSIDGPRTGTTLGTLMHLVQNA
jgi:hypothetical protein